MTACLDLFCTLAVFKLLPLRFNNAARLFIPDYYAFGNITRPCALESLGRQATEAYV